MFTGTKILTVFAPVDSAFTEADIKRLDENRAQARSLVLRHVAAGTLYSAGMHYYQQRESLDKGKQLTVLKEGGTKIPVDCVRDVKCSSFSCNWSDLLV